MDIIAGARKQKEILFYRTLATEKQNKTNKWWSRSTSNRVQVKGAEDVYDNYAIFAVIVLWVASEVPIPLQYLE